MHDLNIFAMASQKKLKYFLIPRILRHTVRRNSKYFSPFLVYGAEGRKKTMERRGEGEEEASNSLKLGPKVGPIGIVRIWQGSTLVPFLGDI